jgi:hypothetical protein
MGYLKEENGTQIRLLCSVHVPFFVSTYTLFVNGFITLSNSMMLRQECSDDTFLLVTAALANLTFMEPR